MAGAGYAVNLSFTDDETFSFVADLDPGEFVIPWPEYRVEYAIRRGCGAPQVFTLDDGVSVDPFINRIFIRSDTLKLRPGTYPHGLRLFHVPTEGYEQVFDGVVTISEGNFPR